ncbi:uncharacterized protein DS421_2g42790 [Arachis hypogaea]|nr:uncharacterized protein DS421_2g42790 [Arachis hypogaea]
MRSTFLASPLSQSHSTTLLLLTPSLPSLWPLNEHTEERREDRRELECSLEEAPKQPSLVAVPQRPTTAAATASAQHRPFLYAACSSLCSASVPQPFSHRSAIVCLHSAISVAI